MHLPFLEPTPPPDPSWWGLERRGGRLTLDGHDLATLAETLGTPSYVVSASRLRTRAEELAAAVRIYPGRTRMHVSYKTNLVAGVLRILHGCGYGAEVVNGYELWLARRLGLDGERIVFNGPNKTEAELRAALEADVGLLVVDHLDELIQVRDLARAADRPARIGLRICPDVVAAHMNASSLTGSRRNQFGLDLPGGEVERALAIACTDPHLQLRGAMAHIGSGIHDLTAFTAEVEALLDVQAQAWERGAHPDLLDLGGGLGTRLSREFTTPEMLAYLGFGRLPALGHPAPADLPARYGAAISHAVQTGCARRRIPLPELVFEPGRALVSDSQVLLLRVGHVRERPGVGRFALTDGGAMTVSMMFLSEVHGVFLANREDETSVVQSVFGSLPSPMDVVYRRLNLPLLRQGDVLAVMDAGAYFTSTSTNFGGPRAGVWMVDGAEGRWVRRPEEFADLARFELDLDPSDAQPNRTDS